MNCPQSASQRFSLKNALLGSFALLALMAFIACGGGSTPANLAPPKDLTYTKNPAVYTKGAAISPNTPSNSGGPAASYSVSPALPAGLSLDTGTGIVAGTPTTVTGQATYAVTATNKGGSTSAHLVITVNDLPPAALLYAASSSVYIKGTTIATNAPSNAGGAVVSYGISPVLPAGLSLNTSTGVIAGTPTAVAAKASYTVTATNTGGSTATTLAITVNDAPPNALIYAANPALYTKGIAIAPNTPESSGGAVVNYSVAPDLPLGLALNPTTGVIAGTPTAVATAADYIVTAANSGGSTIAILTITVNDAPPSGLAYANTTAIYTKGTAITPNTPSSTGGMVLSYAISPGLPGGLRLDASTGIISGTPTTVTVASTYTITAANTSGSTTATVSITVNDVAPNTLVYAANPASYLKGTAISPNAPSSLGGAVVSYSATPALPPGLSLNTSTGVIAGTPTALVGTTSYTITARNSGGHADAVLSIAVVDAAPNALVYSTQPAIYTKGTAISPNTPTSQGGAVVSYGVTPALPPGLTLNTSTGVISGTPTSVRAAAIYTISAFNSGGSTDALLSVTVKDVLPSALSYTQSTPIYIKGTAIAANSPTVSGGTVVSYSVSPALPAGLNLDSGTGVISGTPTVVTAATTFTVAAANSGGNTSTALTITVNDQAPSLSFGSSRFLFTTNSPIPALTPSNSGGAVVTWTISPVLPAGLTFNTANGSITGTPTSITPESSYTITANNSGGSNSLIFRIAVNPPAPAFIAQPSDGLASIGQTATFHVTVSGTGTLSYQWLRDGVAIPGASASTYTTPVLTLSDNAASFSLIVGDAYGQNATSSTAVLTVVQGLFTNTAGTLGWARFGHTATRLPDGKILIAGGSSGAAVLSAAELFDPATGTTIPTPGSMGSARINHTAVLLPSGKVLITGGSNGTTVVATAELYDPATRAFTSTAGPMSTTRQYHTATLLPNGKVLIAGGYYSTVFATAELYDPSAGTFAPTGDMLTARAYHTATLLPNGRVLIAGGSNIGTTHTSAELYDMATGVFTPAGSLGTARSGHTATLMPNGKVLVLGGKDSNSTTLTSAELYAPAADNFTPTGSMTTARTNHTVTMLPDGRVLATGGSNTTGALFNTEVYDPSTGTFAPTGPMGMARKDHTATLLPNGQVLLVGGSDGSTVLSGAEAYDPQDPAPGVFTATGSLGTARALASASLLPDGTLLIAGGTGTSGTVFASAETYDPSHGTFVATGTMTAGRYRHTATRLPNGKTLIAGGISGLTYPLAAELYDSALGSFSTTGNLITARQAHTATLLPNGKVLLAGGWNGSSALASAELYDPSTGTFSATAGPLGTARQLHTATLLPNGKVLIAGGDNGISKLTSAELYDPATNSFTSTGLMTAGWDYHTATLMGNGKVLITGGWDGVVSTTTAQVYDPSLGTFATVGSMNSARSKHNATLLPNGKILIVGGTNGGSTLASAEWFDPSTNVFSSTGTMNSGRSFFECILMPNGKVLAIGGYDGSNYLVSAEQYQ